MPRYLTEKESADLVCPDRISIMLSKPVAEAANWAGKDNDGKTDKERWKNLTHCQGPDCMLWRWRFTIEALGEKTSVDSGYCSKFGKED